MRRTRARLLGALLLVGAVTAAGCGTRLDREAVLARSAGSGGSASGSSGGVGSSGTGDLGGAGSTTGAGDGAAAGSGAGGAGGDLGGTTGGTTGGGTATAGTDGGATAAASGPAKYDTGISDTEVKIGLTSPLSGILGFVGEEIVGSVDAYMKRLNESGGVGGRQVKLIAYDDRLDPSQMLANVKRLFEQDKVFTAFSILSDSLLEYVNSHDYPLMTFGATAPPFSSKYPTVFPLIGNALTWNQESAYALVNHIGIKPKRVGILYDTTLFDERGYLKYFKETWERLGAEVVSMDPVNLTDADCTSVALKMRSLNVDWWDFEGLGWLLCASAMDRIGWRPALGMGGWPTSVGGIGGIVGPIIQGVLGGNQGDQPTTGAPRQKSAAHDELIAAIAKYHPNLNNFADLESPVTTGYWVASRLTIDALKAIGPNFTRKAFIDWLHNIKDYEVGVQPSIKSLAADCKRGSGGTWWALWKYDPAKKLAVRTPGSPYVGGFWADIYGGPCYVTKVADEIVGA